MTLFIQYAIIGIATGAVYALLAQGVVVIHRASGVVNFSQGGFAVMAGFFFASLTQSHGWGTWPAFAVVCVGATAVGVIVYWVAMRPLGNSSQLTRVFATLAVLLIMEGIATVPWSGDVIVVYPFLPSSILSIGAVTFNLSQVVLVAIAVGVTLLLWAVTRFTLPGLAMRALAENRRATAALGWSPDALATSAWALGGLVGAAGGMLIAPVTGVNVGNMTLYVVPAFAAALVGSFTSFPLTLLGAVVIGILQAEASNYLPNIAGAQDAVPFLALVLILTVRGRGLPLRGHVSAKFAELGTGRISWRGAIPIAAVFGVLMAFVFSANLDAALIASLAFAVILLSVVVLTGYAGQLSLAQLTFGGVGALIAGRLVESAGFAFLPALLAGIVATVPIGAIFALPALRTRGMALAMLTLGMATAVASVVFSTTSIVGGIGAGTPINQQSLFGWNITAVLHPGRYAVVSLVLLTLCALAVLNLRRSRAGRRLIAVRTNERAAAALGVNVYAAKVYAFSVAAAIAALGGILLAFQFETIDYSAYDSFDSVLAGSYSVIGGVGYVGGAVNGSVLAQGGFGTWLLNLFGTSVTNYLPLIGGIGLLLMLLQNPNGLQSANLKALGALKRRVRRRPAAGAAALPSVEVTRVTPGVLEVRDLAVTFGGVKAVDGVDLTLRAGRISALIGPNGAGKTSVIDAITGFVRPARGSIRLNDVDVTRWQTYRRARAGLSRSFQSLELFEGVSVRENLLTACEDRDFAAYGTNLVNPGKANYAAAAIAAIREFGLEPDLDLHPAELPYGRRRLVAIARAVASEPSVLLLDEPAAGLDENEAVEFARLIRRLADTWGLAILVVEHDMSLVMSICDEITVIDFGRQIAHGTPHEIRHDPSVIAAYLGEPEDEGEARGDRALAHQTDTAEANG